MKHGSGSNMRFHIFHKQGFCIPSSLLLLPLGACYVLHVCFGLGFGRPLFFIYYIVFLPIKNNVFHKQVMIIKLSSCHFHCPLGHQI